MNWLKLGLLLVLIFFICNSAIARSIEATTGDGKKVVLKSDGSWSYKSNKKTKKGAKKDIPSESNELFMGRHGLYELWYDSNTWKVSKGYKHPDGDITLVHSDGDAYVVVIAERLSMSIDTLKDLAFENAREAAPDIKIIFEESKNVNGVDILHMQMDGTIQKIPFTYYSYYWGGEAGTLQVLAYTGQNLFKEYRPDFTNILNGLVIKKQ